MTTELEYAFHYAAEAGDIASLKGLARRENEKLLSVTKVLVAVLEATGPVTLQIEGNPYSVGTRDGGFTLTPLNPKG